MEQGEKICIIYIDDRVLDASSGPAGVRKFRYNLPEITTTRNRDRIISYFSSHLDLTQKFCIRTCMKAHKIRQSREPVVHSSFKLGLVTSDHETKRTVTYLDSQLCLRKVVFLCQLHLSPQLQNISNFTSAFTNCGFRYPM